MPDRIPAGERGEPIAATDEQRVTINRLLVALEKRQPRLQKLDRYYRGEQPLRFAGEKFREAFGGAFKAFSNNFLALVVEAEEERLNVEGFRIGTPPLPEEIEAQQAEQDAEQDADEEPAEIPAGGAEPAAPGGSARPPARRRTRALTEDLDLRQSDRDARRFWQENMLDAESSIGHTEALVMGLAYALVWARDGSDGKRTTPRITIESPLEMIHEAEPGDRRKITIAAKTWRNADGYQELTLYRDDRVEKYRSANKVTEGTTLGARRWVRRIGIMTEADPDNGVEEELEEWPLEHELGRVPIVVLGNRPRLDGSYRSEIEDLLTAQDAINKLEADLLVAAEFAAFRQRWATGIEVPEDETGQPIEQYKAAVNRVWAAEGDKARFGDFDVSDLRPYIAAIEKWIQNIATRSRTPAHYLLGQSGRFPSGESLTATETGLVAKARRAMRWYGEAWEDVMRLAFRAQNPSDKRADEYDSETIWSDPETRSEAEHTDAVLKLKGLNIPDEFLWEVYGFTQNQIARLLAMRAREADSVGAAFERALASTPPPPPPATEDQEPAPGQPVAEPYGITQPRTARVAAAGG